MPNQHLIAPMPGIFFRRSAPETPPYKEVGDRVEAGEIVCLIEVMKTFVEVKAEFGGTLVRFLVEDNAMIDAGQPFAELT